MRRNYRRPKLNRQLLGSSVASAILSPSIRQPWDHARTQGLKRWQLRLMKPYLRHSAIKLPSTVVTGRPLYWTGPRTITSMKRHCAKSLKDSRGGKKRQSHCSGRQFDHSRKSLLTLAEHRHLSHSVQIPSPCLWTCSSCTP